MDGLRSLLAKETNITIAAEATNGNEVLAILAATPIDIVVLDIGMPELDGYETVLKMKQLYPDTKVIILSLHKEEKYINKLIKAGVAGYIIKDRGSEELVLAINKVAAGREYFDEEVKEITFKSVQNKSAGPEREIRFTSREIEILHLIAEGYSSKEIGKKLHIESSTVETHRKNLLSKLELPNSKHLIKYAIEKGFGQSPLK